MQADPIDEERFWVTLPFHVSGEMAGIEGCRRCDMWCDGFVAETFDFEVTPYRVRGRTWIGLGPRKQEPWTFELLLPDSVASREQILWSLLLPAADAAPWLGVDPERKHLTVDPAGVAPFEHVYTMTDFVDGPRAGIADLDREPHFFESEWNDAGDDTGTFLLTPVDEETMALAREDWDIWTRWNDAFHRGLVDLTSHPALPADRPRHLELQEVLSTRRVTDPSRAVRKRGTFRPCLEEASPPGDCRPLEVRWYDSP